MAYEHWLVSVATVRVCDWEDPPSETSGSLFVGYFTVSFCYSVNDKYYVGRFHSSHGWEKGAEVGILYNPENPTEISVCDEYASGTEAALGSVLELLGGF